MRTVLAPLLLVAVVASGCSSPHRTQSELATDATAIEVVDARFGDDAIYVRYSGVVEQSQGIEHREVLNATAVPVRQFELAALMTFVPPAEWDARSEGAEPIPVLPLLLYDDVVDAVMAKIAPTSQGEITSLRTKVGDYAIWIDELGDPHLTPLAEVVGEKELTRTTTPDELRALALADMAERLPAGTRRALIYTRQTGTGASPFLYVDLDEELFNLLQVQGVRGAQPLEPVGMGVDGAWHLAGRSFFLEIFRSPFRMATRTVTWVGYTAGDIALSNRTWGYTPGEAPPLYEGPGMDLEEFEEVLDRRTREKRTWGRVEGYQIDGDEFFPQLFDSMARAEKSIDMRVYLFDNDDFAVRLADAMKVEAENGKRVRILTDGLGTLMAGTIDSPYMPSDFQKPAKISWYFGGQDNLTYRSQTNPLLMGDHAKSIIIDGERAYLGGMNMGREYRYEYHDMMFEVSGPVVDHVQQQFDNIWELGGFFGDWQFASYQLFGKKVEIREKREGDYPIRMLRTIPGNSQVYKAQLEAIRRAKKRIYIQNLYFSNKFFLQDLIDARQRGVDVRVVMPQYGNWGVLSDAAMHTANKMFEAGIRVYMLPRMTHVKAAVYDGWACVGSANFDKLSFRVNEEINLGYTDPEAVEGLIERLFEPDFEEAVEMTERYDSTLWNNFAAIITNQL